MEAYWGISFPKMEADKNKTFSPLISFSLTISKVSASKRSCIILTLLVSLQLDSPGRYRNIKTHITTIVYASMVPIDSISTSELKSNMADSNAKTKEYLFA